MEITKNNLETYQALKTRQADEFNNFKGIFFAFSNEQFTKGMKKIGFDNENDLKEKIVSLGAGGYMRKDKREAFRNMCNRHDEEKSQRKKDEKFLIESLVYELRNHEYCITGEIEPALNALGYDIKDINSKLLSKACSLSM